jgi:23S rRNA (adenine2503-C2)-methyltransferase
MTTAYATPESRLPNIKDCTIQELEAILSAFGEPGFRAAQLHRWLFSQRASDFEEMTTLGAALRKKLGETYAIRSASVISTVGEKKGNVSGDAGPTAKYLLRLDDDETIESVLIPSGTRLTACISSQAGCPLACAFCATGSMGFRRNLTASEMTDQVFALQREAEKEKLKQITNLVFMGMGEPLLNLYSVIEAVHILSAANYSFSMSQRKISISTVGLIPEILQLGASGLKTKLAVSLHAADQSKREALMPVAKRYPIEDLRDALVRYTERSGLPVTLVYMMLDGINDTVADARKLAGFAGRFLCKINLIDYNPIVNIRFRPACSETRDTFVQLLLDAGLPVTVRRSQGASINAACGQLATSSGISSPLPR